MSLLTLDPNTDHFYQGKYLVEKSPPIEKQAYCLPLEEAGMFGISGANFSHLAETQNVEELLSNPEDFKLDPFEVQAGVDEWGEISFTTGADDFTSSPVPNFAFYGFYFGDIGLGLEPPPFPISIADFYVDIHPDIFYRVQTDSIPNSVFYGFYFGDFVQSDFYHVSKPNSFYRVQTDSIPNSTFYGFYFGHIGKGRKPQTIPIVLADFYIVSVEFC